MDWSSYRLDRFQKKPGTLVEFFQLRKYIYVNYGVRRGEFVKEYFSTRLWI